MSTVQRSWRGPRARPFLALSIVLHLALLLGVYSAGAYRTQTTAPAAQRARISAALDAARRTQMQRQVRALQDMQRQMAKQAGDSDGKPAAGSDDLPDDPQALLQRAQALADKINATAQKARAAELARLLKITPEAARAKLQVQDIAKAKLDAAAAAAVNKTPGDAIAQLEKQARSALERQAQAQARQDQGSLVQTRRDGQPHSSGPAAAAAQRSNTGGQKPSGAAAMAGGPSAGSSGSGSSGSGDSSSGNGAMAGAPSSGGFKDPRSYGATVQANAVDATALRPGAGRIIGRGGPLATRIYLNSWYILGPFEGLGAGSLNAPFPPEKGVDLDAAYEGLGQRVLVWDYQTSAAYPFVPQPRAENSVYFAYTEIRVDDTQEVWLEIGADDDSKLWLNDDLVWTGTSGNKPWYRQPFYSLKDDMQRLNLVEGRRRVLLKAGRNRLLFKLYNGIDLMFFAVVVTP
jgi:hypothetical protein